MSEGPILACTDLSDASLPALKRAASLASATSRSVVLLHVVNPHAFIPPHLVVTLEAHDAAKTHAEREIKKAAVAHFPGLDVRTEVIEETNPVRAICDRAQQSGASLIVIGSHGRSGWSRMMIGSVAERVVRHAECDVLVVRSAD